MSSVLPRRRAWGLAVVLSGSLVLAGCQSGGSEPSASGSPGGEADGGTTITLWTRSSTADLTQLLVDAYNASHRNQVELTVIPYDTYQQKVATAAGSGGLPDVLSSDVVYMSNYTSKNMFLDITDRYEALPFKDDLAPAHIDASRWDGKVYGLPHAMDLSVLYYNKVLFEKAGLDPEQPPTTLTELAEDARAIRAAGDDDYGFYFSGNCGGCLLFNTWPSIWASGGTVMNDEGTESTIDNDAAAGVYEIYRDLFNDGVVPQNDVRNENGSTQTAIFEAGHVGMVMTGATSITSLLAKQGDDLQIGVAPIGGVDGGESSFIGGDVIGISASSAHPDEAWDFISWTLSDEAQVEVVSKSGNITARTDLAVNTYTEDDPIAQVFNGLAAIGQAPFSVNFGATYNDPNGPWLTLVRAAIFGDQDVRTALDENNDAITQMLRSGS